MMMKRDNGRMEGLENGKSTQKVCQDPKSQVAGLKVTEKSTTQIRRKRVNSQ
jgi:hypothetical protein